VSEKRLKVLDCFSGTGSATKAFEDRGHDVRRLDITDEYGPVEHMMDIRVFAQDPFARFPSGWRPDHVHASPPCEGYSVSSIGRMWLKDGDGPGVHAPKHPTSRLGLELLDATVRMLRTLKPATWSMENPRGMMRKVVARRYADMPSPATASYCRYGPIGPVAVSTGPPMVWAQKMTDFWFRGFDWRPRYCPDRPPAAKTGVGPHGMEFVISSIDGKPCHERARRGSRCGIQRIKGASARAMLPYALSEEIATAVEARHRGHRSPTLVHARLDDPEAYA
jgi:hypothetical protein